MNVANFVNRQLDQIRDGGYPVLIRKMKLSIRRLPLLPLYIFAALSVVALRLIRPWWLVRLGSLPTERIGHFAVYTELYLCACDACINSPVQRHVDLFYFGQSVCNEQLARMWKRKLHVWPAWLLAPVDKVNRLIPGGVVHQIGDDTHFDRDIHNLLDRFPAHLHFTDEEEARGQDNLRVMGIPLGAPFVCLSVRDSAYLDSLQPKDWSYHNYRDSNVQNFVLAAEELGNRGYFVIRMGAKVHQVIDSNHRMVIDYATNGMRSEFMDIYLGAKCAFCISVGEGFSAIPLIFRRPNVHASMVPLGYLPTTVKDFVGITKHHIDVDEGRELTLQEIFTRGVGLCVTTADFEAQGVTLIENTPEEIRDVTVEMAERLDGTWQASKEDESLQVRFWEIYRAGAANAVETRRGRPLHTQLLSGRFGAAYLRNNRDWLK